MALSRKCLASLALRWLLRLELLCWLSTCVQGGAWSPWSDWQCAPNGSYAARNRRYACGINETTNCSATDTQVQSNPITFDWTSWSPWVPPCNTTSQTRSRSCVVPPINFDPSTAVCFNCGNQSQVVSQLQEIPQTPCCQAIYVWSQWGQWTCSGSINRSRECTLSSSSVSGDTMDCQTCLPLSSQHQSGDPSTSTCATASSSNLLLPILLSLLALTLICGVLGVAFFALCLREVKLHRRYNLRNWERQTQRPSLNFNSWQEEATPPSSSNIEMLPRDDSAHHFDVIPLERQRPGALGTQVMHPWVPPVRNVEESTADGDPWASEKAAVPATLRVPVGGDPPPQDEDVYHMVRDTISLVHKDLTESGEGVEMASISSPLYEHSDDEGDEVTVI